MSDKNRSKRARMVAGLSAGQAAKILGWNVSDIAAVEAADGLDGHTAELLADIYHVRPEWLCGEVPLRDYVSIENMKGADKLSSHDRDVLAEFAASMKRNDSVSVKDALAKVVEKRK